MDKRILCLITKWLKVGITEGRQAIRSERGALQGSVISPTLANVYLHYVFDLWAHAWCQKATGDVVIIRYPIPKPDPFIDTLIDVIAKQPLVLVGPASSASTLQLIMQASGKALIRMAVAYEAGIAELRHQEIMII